MQIQQSLRDIVVLILRVSIGIIFVLAGIGKLGDIQSFATDIRAFGVPSEQLSESIASSLPFLEIVAGGCMAAGLFTKYSSAIISALLIIFIAFIIPLLAVGKSVNCGCFGAMNNEPLDVFVLLRDIILLVMSVIVVVYPGHIFSLDNALFTHKKTMIL